MESIYSWLKTVVIFMIFLTILTNLLGKSDFKKYINVATGLLLVLVTVSPLLQFLTQEKGFDYYFTSSSFQLQTTEIANEMKQAEENQQAAILMKYKEEIRTQIKDLLEERELYFIDADIVIDEDVESEGYAKIKELTVIGTYSSKVTDTETGIEIPSIEIPEIVIGNKEEKKQEKQTEDFLTPMEIQVKNMLSDFYNIKADNINISIQGG